MSSYAKFTFEGEEILVRLFKLAERRWLSYLAPRKH